MANERRLAVDPPPRSAALVPGPRLLGRVYAPDPRDWTLPQLMEIAEPPESIRQRTIEQVMRETTYFSDWRAYLVFWRWLSRQREPEPRPVDAAPAWELKIQLDQGETGHCVGFGWAGWVDASPVEGSYQNADGHALYYECKVIDGEPLAENGSTVRSGALAVRARGRLAAFAFARTTDEIDEWINTQGSVVVGTTWTSDMFNPDADGYVRPTGSAAGGHCYLMLDRLDAEDAYLFQNSWGDDWGLGGRFKMRRGDFDGLLQDQGEACCAAELPH
ncbi:C1 family peptidase [Micromonospora sp. NPDC049559]|uniref:C1 family peptidase n=1 Tax=Micromonospora sp. NPDC049559 TaxID=3155923 RepID=UPI0034179000